VWLIPTALALMKEDKMRYLISKCIAELRKVEIEKSKNDGAEKNEHESVKRKVFSAAVSMMMDGDQNAIIFAFPDESKKTDERSWLSMYYAVALTVENKVSEEDMFILQAANPLAMHLFSGKQKRGCTPVHLLCTQNRPNVSLVRKICLCDSQAFILCDHNSKSALHMISQHCESLEVLQSVLQIDHSLIKKKVIGPYGAIKATPLGLLCGRSESSSFHRMLLCLIEVDSTRL
jgi:hypothetical protein